MNTVLSPSKPPHFLRRLYSWVLRWADTPYGPTVLGGISFLESSVFPIPPDTLLIPLCLGKPNKALWFATLTTITSVLGGILGYVIGYGFWELAHDFFIPKIFSQASFDQVAAIYQKYDFWFIFVAAFTPIPYKIFTISAGVVHIGFLPFFLASLIGRAGRFFLVAGLIYLFGVPIAKFIEKYFEWLVVAFTVLLVGAYFLIEWIV